MGEILLCSHLPPLGEILLYSSFFPGGNSTMGGNTTLQHRCCIVVLPPSHISPRKNGYIVDFPPGKWLYSSFPPGEIWLYTHISPLL